MNDIYGISPDTELSPSVVDDLLSLVPGFFNSILSGEEPSQAPVETVAELEDFFVYDEEYGVQVYALNPITSATGLKGVLLDVLGDYDAIVVEYRYQTTTSGNYNYVREIQPDFPWLCSAGIFLALLWSVFSIGGRLICRK